MFYHGFFNLECLQVYKEKIKKALVVLSLLPDSHFLYLFSFLSMYLRKCDKWCVDDVMGAME